MDIEPRSYLAKALTPIFLTALGTLAVQCAQYIYFAYPREIREIRDSYESEQIRTIALQNYRLSFMHAKEKALSNILNRKSGLDEALRPRTFTRDPNALHAFQTKAWAMANEASNDHGMLVAFAPDGKYVTQVGRDALVEMASDEVALWEGFYRCSKAGMTTSEVSFCDNEIPVAVFNLSKAMAFVVSTKDSLNLNDSIIEVDRERSRRQYEARANEMWRWYMAAWVGLFCSTIAFCLLIYLSFGSVVDLGRNAPARSQTRPGCKVGSKGDQIRNRYPGRISWS